MREAMRGLWEVGDEGEGREDRGEGGERGGGRHYSGPFVL
jgi:hypothetical protein